MANVPETTNIFFYIFWTPYDSNSFKMIIPLPPPPLADEALYYSTIYPNSHDLGTAYASLAFVQLRRGSLFLLSPSRILDGRSRLYSSELSYSFCITSV